MGLISKYKLILYSAEIQGFHEQLALFAKLAG
jgi:hypothetical protein